MHLGGVLAGGSEDVDHLACGVLLVVGPGGYFHYGLVAGLSAAQFVAGNHYVNGQELRVGLQVAHVAGHVEGADEVLLLLLNNLDDFGLGFHATAHGRDAHAHLVAVESVH